MLTTDLRTGIVSCNGKSWKLSPGQHQMLEWMNSEAKVDRRRLKIYFFDYMASVNYLAELVYKGMEGEV